MSIHRSELLQTVEGLFKARYESRKRGRDGKWVYTYAEKKKTKPATKDAEKSNTEANTFAGDFMLQHHVDLKSASSSSALLDQVNASPGKKNKGKEDVYSFKDPQTGEKRFVATSNKQGLMRDLKKDKRFKLEGVLQNPTSKSKGSYTPLKTTESERGGRADTPARPKRGDITSLGGILGATDDERGGRVDTPATKTRRRKNISSLGGIIDA